MLGCGGDRPSRSSADGGSEGIGSFGTGSASSADGSADAGSRGGSEEEQRLDVGGGTGEPNPGGCPEGGGGGGTPGGEATFSIIWIANSGEGTVSKIDTVAAVELARYRTGALDNPDPSRTTVNLTGDVAVVNRSGSVTKFSSVIERCVDRNGNGTIDTSQGPDDVRPWGEDECMLWHHETDYAQGDHVGGPRGTAWDAGNGPCTEANLWFSWRRQPTTTAVIRHLDGATGEVLGETLVPDWTDNWGHGPYGGASDADSNFWGLGTLGTLVKVEPETYDFTRWENPVAHVMYGIALDAVGNPWLAGWDGHLWTFDRATETFIDMGGTAGGPSRMRGLAIDLEGHAWIAGNGGCALVRFDTIAGTLLEGAIPLPGCNEPVGVSIDVDGKVWVVDRGASRAYKVDPDGYGVTTVTGLVQPYTYSDMTGAGLNLVVNPPAG